ncbi:MAG TPA: class I SAM-dependent methyltransferase [Candidatus Saccharibacteria bacterium]|nr:class I SAM-dependent methyltransferase [Candidatus Saccharibacteria bacterium]HMT39454.1 class I SAM-dependent methyltransferase [Candidatus Saccharibacteria bacterium]
MPEPKPGSKDPWEIYYENTTDLKPANCLKAAVEILGRSGNALDLDCGAGRDSRYLLSKGFRVIALDGEKSSEEFIQKLKTAGNIEFVCSAFDMYEYPKNYFDIVNAQFALPFNPPHTFNKVFLSIRESLKPGGIFVGQLFGDHDEWNVPTSKMTFHTKQEAMQLVEGMDIIEFDEEDNPNGTLANGSPKHWHTFTITFRKP